MKKLAFVLLTLFGVCFSLHKPSVIWAEGISEENRYVIQEFKSNIVLKENTDLYIVETIKVNFPHPKHGIFRIIPVIYSVKGKTIRTRFEVLSVTDESGTAYQHKQTRLGQSVKLRIGDEDIAISGFHTYNITYRVSGVVQRLDGHDEIYWNVTGHEWDTDILSATAAVQSEYANILKTDCFAGTIGGNVEHCQIKSTGNRVEFESTEILGGGKDFTIVLKLDRNNQLNFPGKLQVAFSALTDNWGYAPAVLPLIVMIYLWYRHGRDRRYVSENIYYKPDKVDVKTVSLFARKHIPLVYHPLNGLSPSEVGTIIDERVDIADVIAEIVELARIGFIKIQKIEYRKLFGTGTEYAFVKTNAYSNKTELSKLKNYQRYLLREIFRSTVIHRSVGEAEKLFKRNEKKLDAVRRKLAKREYVLLSALQNHFYEGLPVFKNKLYKRMETEGLFAGDPEKVRASWIGIYVVICIISTALTMAFVITFYNFVPVVLLMATSVAGFVLVASMPRRTPKGYSLYRQIEGLKWYLTKGKWRYEHMEKSLFFEEILPLAIALGVVGKLTKDMAGLGVKPPSYFVGSGAAAFMADIGNFQAKTTNSLLSSPSGKWTGNSSWSGGSGFSGGFSGGGFGGGGGGSW
jgi:uncharacterized membrane protein YgcG